MNFGYVIASRTPSLETKSPKNSENDVTLNRSSQISNNYSSVSWKQPSSSPQSITDVNSSCGKIMLNLDLVL